MSLTIKVETTKPASAKVEVLAFAVNKISDLEAHFPEKIANDLAKSFKKRGFKAEWGSALIVPAVDGVKAEMVAVIGLGDGTINQHAEGLRRGLAAAVIDLRKHGLQELAIVITAADTAAQNRLVRAAVEAASLTAYSFADFSPRLKKQQQKNLKKLQFITDKKNKREVDSAVRSAKAIQAGIDLTRNLVNQPANAMSPTELVAAAKEIADDSDLIRLKTFNRQQAENEGFTAFLEVAKGSAQEPYVIHLVYRPENVDEETQKLALVGKGITFDSGGLSLKPADYMEDMKIDMAGAATVLGVFASLDKLKPQVEIHGIIAACENMPSGDAYRPGDVITAMNGKTIEVLNTDAEGRVTLADALTYALKQEPDEIIDLATLTGAAMVALGETYAGLWATNNDLAKKLKSAAEKNSEGITQLPLPSEYRQQILSDIADVRNTATSRYGGAITAALFLREFVDDTPWAHLDIAGPSHMSHSWLKYYGKGATGFGVRTLIDFISAKTSG